MEITKGVEKSVVSCDFMGGESCGFEEEGERIREETPLYVVGTVKSNRKRRKRKRKM